MSSLKNSLISMALDLDRVAIGINRGSERVAKRFFQEALARKSEINTNEIPVYVRRIMTKIDENENLNQDFAEKVLVYSILLENYATRMIP